MVNGTIDFIWARIYNDPKRMIVIRGKVSCACMWVVAL